MDKQKQLNEDEHNFLKMLTKVMTGIEDNLLVLKYFWKETQAVQTTMERIEDKIDIITKQIIKEEELGGEMSNHLED